MEKEFIPYELALRMKQLGFDEPCFAYWGSSDDLSMDSSRKNNPFRKTECIAPTFSQAFKWFREKYNLKSCIMFRTSMEDNKEYYDWLIKGQEVVYRHFNTYEEAELAALEKLIEIVEQSKSK